MLRWLGMGLGLTLLAIGCGSDDNGYPPGPGGTGGSGAAGTGGTAGSGTGGNGGTVAIGCNPDDPQSEGTPEAPVVLPPGPISYVGGLRDRPSYYRLTGLEVGARYRVQVDGVVWGLQVFHQGFDGTPICKPGSSGSDTCLAVPQTPSLDVMLIPFSNDDGWCVNLDVTLDSPAGAFEGAKDNFHTLRYGTPDLPHRGIVDHENSYYRISQLTPGKRYRVHMTGRDAEMFMRVGEQQPEGGMGNSVCLADSVEDPDTRDQDASCIFDAVGDSMGVDVWHWDSLVSGKYVLSVFEELESEGTPGSPLVLPYGSGLQHAGRVEARLGSLEPSYSYYEVTGLTPGQTYLFGLSDAGGLRAFPYTDSNFTTRLSCENGPNAFRGCQITATASTQAVAVENWDIQSRQFALHVREWPSDEGDLSARRILAYPADFPFSGQVAFASWYTVTGLPAGPVTLALADTDGPVDLNASTEDGTARGCNILQDVMRCTMSNSQAGEARVTVTGTGHFVLDAVPAPELLSDYVSTPGVVPIPNGSAAGLSDTLTVSGSSVTSIEAVTVELFTRHGRPLELEAYLVAPDGTTEVQLANKSGGPYEGTRFDDYALERFEGWHRDVALSKRPFEPLHTFEGIDANGSWTLRVVDDADPNISDNDGDLLGWGLSFR